MAYYDMSLEDLSKFIGNKKKATDIYNDTGIWDSGLKQQNEEIRRRYGIDQDIDLNTANTLFNQRMNTVNKHINKNVDFGSRYNDNLINLGNNNNTGNMNMGNMNMSNANKDPYQTEYDQYIHPVMREWQNRVLNSNIFDDPDVKKIMDMFDKQGNRAYLSAIAEGNSYVGAPNSWTAGQAANIKDNIALQAAMMAPSIYQSKFDNIKMYSDTVSDYAKDVSGRIERDRLRQDALNQQDFANQYAISELMGGATSGLRQYANPYFNQDGTLVNPNSDYKAMIDNLDPNDPYYDQKKYQLEQARFAKVQDPKYSQYAQGVTAPVQAAPIWSASSNNPEIKAQQLANWLTETYKPAEYDAVIAGMNLDNETKRLLNYYLPREKEAGITAQEKANARYDDIINAQIYNQTRPRVSGGGGSSGSGVSTKEVKPQITANQAINLIKGFKNETKTELDEHRNEIKVPAHTTDEVIEYALSLENLGFSKDDIETYLLNAGIPSSAIKNYVDTQESLLLPASMGDFRLLPQNR